MNQTARFSNVDSSKTKSEAQNFVTNHTVQKLKDRIRLYNAEEIHDKKFGEMQRQFEKIGKEVVQKY